MTLLDTQKGKWYQVKRIIEERKGTAKAGGIGNFGRNQSAGAQSEKKRLYDHPCAGNPLGLRTGYRRRY